MKHPLILYTLFDLLYQFFADDLLRGDDPDEIVTSARLMAASPELLEACIAARKWFGEKSDDDSPHYVALIDQLERAIERASNGYGAK